MHSLRKTLIILTALISFFCGFLFSRLLLPNSEEREGRRNVNNEKSIVNVETEDKEYQILACSISKSSSSNNLGKEMRLITISKDKKIIRVIKPEFVGEIYGFETSPDGKKVLVDFAPATSRHRRLLYIMNIDGTRRINLTEGIWLSYSASLSPDGKKVAFIGSEENFKHSDSPNPSLWLVNTDGTERINLLKGMRIKGEITGPPVFSPDSKKILFKSGENTECLYMFDLEKNNLVTIAEKPGESFGEFFFSPDSKKVLFESTQGYYLDPKILNIANIDGSERKNIAESVGVESSEISPDGKKVAFIGYMSGYSSNFVDSPNPSLWLVNTDGTEMKSLLEGMRVKESIPMSPVFSPDSKKILFKLRWSGSESLCIFDLNEEKIITLAEAERVPEYYYQFSPDGKKILFATGSSLVPKRFYIINNDGTSMISLEGMIMSNIQDAKWVPYKKNDS
jgi:Tol biopolymer transport system component